MRPLEIPTPSKRELEALEETYQKTRDVQLHTRIQIVFLVTEQHLTAGQLPPSCAVMKRRFVVGSSAGEPKGWRDSRIGPCQGRLPRSRRSTRTGCWRQSAVVLAAWSSPIRCGRSNGWRIIWLSKWASEPLTKRCARSSKQGALSSRGLSIR